VIFVVPIRFSLPSPLRFCVHLIHIRSLPLHILFVTYVTPFDLPILFYPTLCSTSCTRHVLPILFRWFSLLPTCRQFLTIIVLLPTVTCRFCSYCCYNFSYDLPIPCYRSLFYSEFPLIRWWPRSLILITHLVVFYWFGGTLGNCPDLIRFYTVTCLPFLLFKYRTTLCQPPPLSTVIPCCLHFIRYYNSPAIPHSPFITQFIGSDIDHVHTLPTDTFVVHPFTITFYIRHNLFVDATTFHSHLPFTLPYC